MDKLRQIGKIQRVVRQHKDWNGPKENDNLIENSTAKFHGDLDIGRSKLGSGKERKSESSGMCGWDEIGTTGFPHSGQASKRIEQIQHTEAISLSDPLSSHKPRAYGTVSYCNSILFRSDGICILFGWVHNYVLKKKYYIKEVSFPPNRKP